MNTYSNISNELKAYFSSHPVFKILLPVDMVLLFAGLGIIALSDIFGMYIGSFVNGLAFWSFILGLLLVYANMKETFLFLALFGYGASNILEFFRYLIGPSHSFGWGNIFYAAVFGGLGYLVFKRVVLGHKKGTDVNG